MSLSKVGRALTVFSCITASTFLSNAASYAVDDSLALVKPPKAPVTDPRPALSPLETNVIQLLLDGKANDAQKLVSDAIKSEKNPTRLAGLYYLRAVVERENEDNKDAADDLQKVAASDYASKSIDPSLQKTLLLKRIGDCSYADRNLSNALSNYTAALKQCVALPPDAAIKLDLLEASMGILIAQKKYPEAETYGKQLVSRAESRARSGRLDDLGRLFWAQLELISLYRTTGQDAERLKLREPFVKLFNQLTTARNELVAQSKLPGANEWSKIFQADYINQYKPATAAEYLWLSNEFKFRSLPLVSWRPQSGTPKGVLLCIHGLGLDNLSYTWFANEMTKRGYVVFAMDVRGFGSWMSTPGAEDVNFEEAIEDIGGVLNLIKEREPGVPTFVVGESMGGAIALRAGARYGKNLNGIISSVPSAERFQAKRMSLGVAVHFLQSPSKPFHVGDMVAEKATASTELRQHWESDVKAKMDMSPKELLRFALFMRTTKKQCEKIDSTPVFVVQGLKDRLVKPQGTFEMFDAVGTQDKDLFIIGTAEHLIFETDHQSPQLLDTLNIWLNDHSQATQK